MTSSSEHASGDGEFTLSDDPQARADEAATRRSTQRARLSDPAVRAELRRRKRRNNRIAIGAGVTLVLVLVAYLAVYFLPLMAVRTIEVTGVAADRREQVVEQAQVAKGTPLMQVDSRQVAQRVAVIPQVSEVRVVREYPSTLRIEIVERQAAAWMLLDGAVHVFDAEGVDFEQPDSAPEGLVEIELGDTASQFRTTAVATSVEIAQILHDATAARGAAQQVTKVESESPQGYVLTLADGRRLEWGSDERSEEKAEAFAVVMDRPGQVWNLANPAMPTSRD